MSILEVILGVIVRDLRVLASFFLRWAQMGAFVPLMENGGGGNHFPWEFDNGTDTTTTDIYRDFVNIHYQLKPYFLSAAALAYVTGDSVIIPLADSVIYPYHSWDYFLWTDIFVAPIVESSLLRTIDFPSGNDWIFWFNSSQIYHGGLSFTLQIPLSQFPAFHRSGSMLPLHVDTSSQHGDPSASGYLTVLIHPLPNHQEQIVVRRWKDVSSELSYIWDDTSFRFTATASTQGIIVLIKGVSQCPSMIHEHVYDIRLPSWTKKSKLNLEEWGYFCDKIERQLFVRFGQNTLNGIDLAILGLNTIYSK